MALASSLAPQPGDHLCGFYYGDEERDALLLPFLRAGLQSGDKCLAVVDSTPVEQVIAEVTTGLDADALLASGQHREQGCRLARDQTDGLRITSRIHQVHRVGGHHPEQGDGPREIDAEHPRRRLPPGREIDRRNDRMIGEAHTAHYA